MFLSFFIKSSSGGDLGRAVHVGWAIELHQRDRTHDFKSSAITKLFLQAE
jgi:hypothetical protein